jgi:DNA-binding transcriptional LysR family regulator
MFEFNQLRCFVAVAEELHFGRAAHRLNMTQPPLSRQIQLLEHELGVTLFDRTSRSVQLTQAGRVFLPEARQMLRLAEGAAMSARRVERGEAGLVTLGYTAGSSYGFLPRLVNLAMAEMPDVDLVLREMISARQMEALGAGQLDAGLVRLPVDRRGNELICVLREPLMLAVPENHSFAGGEPRRLRDLDRAPFIMYSTDSPTEGRYFHDLTTSVFRAAGIAPNYVQHCTQVHAVLALVSAGMGVALVPRSAGNLLARGVVLRELQPMLRPMAELNMIWRRGNDNPAFQVFRNSVLPQVIEG